MTIFVSVNHGECEIILCIHLSKLLRIDIVPVSKNRGKETISLRESERVLKEGPFKNLNALNKYYREYKKYRVNKKLKLSNIKIFIIMDVDGDSLSVKSFKTKEMFKNSPFYDCIVPILNNPNLDEIMRQCGFDLCDRNKPITYGQILDGLNSIQEFEKRLEGKNSDLLTMIKLLKSHCSNFQE